MFSWSHANSIFHGIKTFYIADVGYMDDVGFYDKKDSYKHEASEIRFDNPDLQKFPRFKDVEWQRVDLTPGDGRSINRIVHYYVPYTIMDHSNIIPFLSYDAPRRWKILYIYICSYP